MSGVLARELERAVLSSREALDRLIAEGRRLTDTGAINAHKLKIQAAHADHQRCLAAFFAVDKSR